MSSLSRARVIVVGAGVLGLSAALALERRGARLTVLDAEAGANSASAAAAGMIAPGLEAALERAAPDRAALYAEAAALWPALSAAYDLSLVRDGADWIGPDDDLAPIFEAHGTRFARIEGGLHLPGEGRLEAPLALARMAAALRGDLAGQDASRIGRRGSRFEVITPEGSMDADAVVLAAGWSAPNLQVEGIEGLGRLISPIKGQIITLAGDGVDAVVRTRRGPGGYLVPTSDGLIVGATMETGVADLKVDPVVAEALRMAAVRMEPALANASLARAWAGVRGATPDGLPLVGATAVPNLFVALAPRRNGWLLAPLVGEALAAAVAQESPPPPAVAFRPDRFDPA